MKTTPDSTVIEILRRLLAGERGHLPLHLAMLLERASCFDSGDEHYSHILPPEISDLRISTETANSIIVTLCAEVSRNPDEALIGAMSFTGAELATKTAVKVLTDPPRPLTMSEYHAALSLLVKFLPGELAEDSEFVSKADLEHLVQLTGNLQNIDETGPDRTERIGVRIHAGELFERLTELGFDGG